MKLISVRELKDGLEGGMIEGGAFPSSDDKPMVITGFSTGYGGNSLAIGASAAEYAIAAGTAPAQINQQAAEKPPAKAKKGHSKATKKTKKAAKPEPKARPKKVPKQATKTATKTTTKTAAKGKQGGRKRKQRSGEEGEEAGGGASLALALPEALTVAAAKRLKVAELRAELGKRTLDCGGLKAVLFERLKVAIEAEEG